MNADYQNLANIFDNLIAQHVLDEPTFGKALDSYVRAELNIKPDEDVDENMGYWNLSSLIMYQLMTRFLATLYAPSTLTKAA